MIIVNHVLESTPFPPCKQIPWTTDEVEGHLPWC